MLTKAVVAQPVPRSACAISSYLLTAMVAAHELLVPRYCRRIPLPIPVIFCMGRRSHELMQRWDTHLILPFLLRHNPAVLYHLPCQSPTKRKECGASWKGPFSESEVPRQRKAFTSVMARMNENTRVSHRCVFQLSSIEGNACRRLL